MYYNKLNFVKKIKIFKKRRFPKIKLFLFKSFKYICVKVPIVLELKFYKFYLLKLRKLFRKKKIKIFILFSINFIFSKKSKGARMGKGKGKFRRFQVKLKPLQPLFFFSNISYFRIKKFLKFLNKKQNIFFYV